MVHVLCYMGKILLYHKLHDICYSTEDVIWMYFISLYVVWHKSRHAIHWSTNDKTEADSILRAVDWANEITVKKEAFIIRPLLFCRISLYIDCHTGCSLYDSNTFVMTHTPWVSETAISYNGSSSSDWFWTDQSWRLKKHSVDSLESYQTAPLSLWNDKTAFGH